jgi:hypothetical protein
MGRRSSKRKAQKPYILPRSGKALLPQTGDTALAKDDAGKNKAVIFGGLAVALVTAIVTLMSGLPIFWPLLLFTAAIAVALSAAAVSLDYIEKRPVWIRVSTCLLVTVILGVVMFKPLREQYRRESSPQPAAGPTSPTFYLGRAPSGVIPFGMIPHTQVSAAVATAAGTVELEGPFLKVAISRIVVRTREPGETRLAYLRPAIAKWQPAVDPHSENQAADWYIAEWGEKYPVNERLETNASRSFPGFERLIAIDSVPDVQHAWVVLECGLEVGKDHVPLATYSSSDRLIFHYRAKPRWWWRLWPWSPLYQH